MNLPQRIGSKLRRESSYLRKDVNHLLRLDERFFKNARGSRILVYHGICLKDHTKYNPIFLKLKTFEQHLALYKKYFNIISLDDYYLQNFDRNKFNVCLTFDDGFANNHKYVLPLLKKYQIPATFFVTAIRDAGHDILWNDLLGIVSKYGPNEMDYKNEPFYKGKHDKYISNKSGLSLVEILRSDGFEAKAEMMKLLYPLVPFKENRPNDTDYWLQMSGEQIKEVAACPFATIGSHGYYHNDLARIPINQAADDLVNSKNYLESLINKPVNSLAFPYGSYTASVVEAAKSAGYTQLLATDFLCADNNEDLTMRERFTVNPFISPVNQLHANITRSYER